MSQKNVDALKSPKYFEHVVQRIEAVIKPQPSGGSSTFFLNSVPSHFFHEFPGAAEGTLVTIVMELLLLPLTAHEVMSGLLIVLQKPDSIGYSTVVAVSLIAANLPQSFHDSLYDHAISIIKDIGIIVIEPINTLCVDYSASKDTISDRPINLLLTMMHSFLHNSGVDELNTLPNFIKRCRPFKNIIQYFVACKLVAPFVHRVSSEILQEILLELMRGLVDISVELSSYSYQPTVISDNNPLALFDVIVDFFYYCKYEYKLSTTTLRTLTELSNLLGEHAQLKFTHLYYEK